MGCYGIYWIHDIYGPSIDRQKYITVVYSNCLREETGATHFQPLWADWQWRCEDSGTDSTTVVPRSRGHWRLTGRPSSTSSPREALVARGGLEQLWDVWTLEQLWNWWTEVGLAPAPWLWPTRRSRSMCPSSGGRWWRFGLGLRRRRASVCTRTTGCPLPGSPPPLFHRSTPHHRKYTRQGLTQCCTYLIICD